MYVIILFFLITGLRVHGAEIQNSSEVLSFSDRLVNLINEHCSQNANETDLENVLEGLQEFKDCWVLELPEEKFVGESFYKYCIVETEAFTRGLHKFVNKLSTCMAPEEDYLKSFILNSYGNYNHHFCKHLAFQSKATKNNIMNCLERLEHNAGLDPLIVCYKNSSVFGDNSTLDVISKQELCQDILRIRQCNEEIFTKNCPDVPELPQLRNVLLTQALANCVDVLDEANKKAINGETRNTV